MKRFARILIVCASLGAVALVVYQLLPPSAAGQHAVEQLASVRTFSLGPVGYAGSIPEREDHFFSVLASRHSSRLFRDLYERGTPEAKLYALCGLRLSHGGFEAYATRFTQETTNIATLGGCIGRDCTPSEAISALRQGVVERYLPLRRDHERGTIEYEWRHKPAG
jgi:hypothetical protein